MGNNGIINIQSTKEGIFLTNNKNKSTQRLALLSLLAALVAVLAYLGGFVKIGGLASISLTLIPIVVGAAICGPSAGGFLGGVAGAVFFFTADSVFWFGLSIPGTIITVMVKGILSGYLAGLAYKVLENKNRYLAVIVSAIVCPVVNTGLFILGCFIFFMGTITAGASGEGMSVAAYIIVFYVGLNFVFELLSNIIFSPIILRLINLRNKK